MGNGHGKYIGFQIKENENITILSKGQNLRKTLLFQAAGTPYNERYNYIVEDNASLDLCFVVMPEVNATISITIDIQGELSDVNLSGIYICNNNEQVTFNIIVHHRKGNNISKQLFNGIVAGNAKCSFKGTIIVAPDAQKVEAYQENRNMQLSDNASIKTEPQLEIYADDVKCSHGATLGKLNQEELFYMRSRGIPEHEAKVLQMLSFVSPVISKIAGDEDKLIHAIEDAIRKITT